MQRVVSVKTMRESDAATIRAGVSGRELMLRAAKGVFDCFAWSGKTAIVCGEGNNAGDGYALAGLLRQSDLACTVILLSDRFSEDGAYYFDLCQGAGVEICHYTEDFSFTSYETVVDCIFGTGFRGEVTGIFRQAIKAINQSGKTVISVDINSGLNGESGQGDLCVHSDITVSIGSYKYGHFLGFAKDVIGRLCNVDIGIKLQGASATLLEEDDICAIFPKRSHASHKGMYGYVSVMGGCTSYSGAVKLANLSCAALRAGAGVAQLIVPASLAQSVSPYLLESTLALLPDAEGQMLFAPAELDRILARQSALAIGMGWGSSEQNARILRYVLQNFRFSLVIDADGLNALSTMPDREELLKSSACHVILTPHTKEFERISGYSCEEILRDPVGCVQAYAAKTGCCVLLKGSCTVVSDGKETYLVTRGCPGMATAGSGDVLSGVLAGMLGALPPTPKTVAAGAFLAGYAGELAECENTAVGMLASDTVRCLPTALKSLLS